MLTHANGITEPLEGRITLTGEEAQLLVKHHLRERAAGIQRLKSLQDLRLDAPAKAEADRIAELEERLEMLARL